MGKNTDSEFNQIKYQTEYNKQHYDSITIMIPKGMRDQVRGYAKAENLSVTKYILKTIEFYERRKDM